jgi:predicted DNA-binding transcriptional regulator YafY
MAGIKLLTNLYQLHSPGNFFYWKITFRHNAIKEHFISANISFLKSESFSDTSYSINNMPLNQLELGLLQDLLLNLSHLKGMPKFEWVTELIPKLKEGMVQNTQAKTFMEFDNNPFLRGVENLETLYNAIFNRQTLRIQYQTFDSPEPKTFIIHPYFLKSYNHRWFLFGYYPEAGNPAWNLAIDRIKGIEEAKDKYIENTEIDWNEYFEDMVGVTRPENAQPEKIVLHFLGLRGKYVETKPIHGSQKARWIDDNTLEVQLDLIVNRELVSLLLSYGDDLVINKPIDLRTKLIDILKSTLSIYNN